MNAFPPHISKNQCGDLIVDTFWASQECEIKFYTLKDCKWLVSGH